MATDKPDDGRPTAGQIVLRPILRDDMVSKRRDGTPARQFTSGEVAEVFFDHTWGWLRYETKMGRLPEGVLPPPPKTAGGGVGARKWTLVDIERAAFHLHTSKPSFDAATLVRTLDVIYAVARLYGMMEPLSDPLIEVRGMLSAQVSNRS